MKTRRYIPIAVTVILLGLLIILLVSATHPYIITPFGVTSETPWRSLLGHMLFRRLSFPWGRLTFHVVLLLGLYTVLPWLGAAVYSFFALEAATGWLRSPVQSGSHIIRFVGFALSTLLTLVLWPDPSFIYGPFLIALGTVVLAHHMRNNQSSA